MKKFTKEQAISDLVDNDILTIMNGNFEGDNSYINDIMSDGFKGYWNFTDEELITEYKESLGLDIELLPEEKPFDCILKPISEEQFEAAKAVLIKELEAETEAVINKREVAMKWWNQLNLTSKDMHTSLKYCGRSPKSLTGREIENMYYGV